MRLPRFIPIDPGHKLLSIKLVSGSIVCHWPSLPHSPWYRQMITRYLRTMPPAYVYNPSPFYTMHQLWTPHLRPQKKSGLCTIRKPSPTYPTLWSSSILRITHHRIVWYTVVPERGTLVSCWPERLPHVESCKHAKWFRRWYKLNFSSNIPK